MKKIALPEGEIKIVNSIDELNISAYNHFQYYVAMASNMGNDMEKIRANFRLFFEFMKQKEYEKAENWVQNAYYSTYLNQQKSHPVQLAFAILTYTNREIATQGDCLLSEESLKERAEDLAKMGLTAKIMHQELFFFLKS